MPARRGRRSDRRRAARAGSGGGRPLRSRFVPWPSQPDDRDEERREEDLGADGDHGEREDRKPLFTQNPEPARRPLPDDDPDQRQSGDEHEQRDRKAVLEPQLAAHPLKQLILVADEVDTERPGRQPETNRLDPDQDEEAAEDQGVDEQVPTEDR